MAGLFERSVGEHLGTTRTQDLVLLGALALGAYVVYEIVQGAKTTSRAIGSVVDTVSSGVQQFNQLADAAGESAVDALAKVYEKATFAPPARVTGNVNLQPANQIIAGSQASPMVFDSSANLAYFTFNNIVYEVAPDSYDANGNYLAQPVPDFGFTPSQAAGGWD